MEETETSEHIFEEDYTPKFKLFLQEFPALSEKWIELIHKTEGESKLERKIQELIRVALLAEKCEEGFKFHLGEAMRYGATEEEIVGAILLTLPTCGTCTFLTALAWAKDEGIL